MIDYYHVLQVDPQAEFEVIEAAYRRLARKYHPDVNHAPDANGRMQQLNEAYEVLKDPLRRAAFDLSRPVAKASTSPPRDAAGQSAAQQRERHWQAEEAASQAEAKRQEAYAQRQRQEAASRAAEGIRRQTEAKQQRAEAERRQREEQERQERSAQMARERRAAEATAQKADEEYRAIAAEVAHNGQLRRRFFTIIGLAVVLGAILAVCAMTLFVISRFTTSADVPVMTMLDSAVIALGLL